MIDLLARRREMMVQPQGSVLPEGYTQLNYIANESNTKGKFHIPAISSPFVFRAKIMMPNVSLNNYGCVAGYNFNFQVGITAIGKATQGQAAYPSTSVFFYDNVMYEMEACFNPNSSSSYYYVDGVDTGMQRSYSLGNTPYIMSNNTTNYYIGRLYEASISDLASGDTLHKFVPCIDPNNIVGMYDIITQTFYGAETGGYFIGA